MVRIGNSRNSDATKAARHCVAAVAGCGPVEWAMAFCGGKHDPHAFLAELRAVLGEIPIVGGSAAGVITREGASYSGIETAVACFIGGQPRPFIAATHALARGESAAGQ